MIGIDLSESFITAAGQLQRDGRLDYSFAIEGELGQAAIAEVPTEVDRTRVRFEQGDATFLRDGLGQFDIVLMANLIDRLPCPAKCLEQLPGLLPAGGQLIIATPCTWLEEYTPKAEWLGGSQALGQAQTRSTTSARGSLPTSLSTTRGTYHSSSANTPASSNGASPKPPAGCGSE